MGEPAEAPDNVAMMFGMRKVIGAETARQRDGPFLVGQVFRMRERQYEELAHLEREFAVIPGGERTRFCAAAVSL